MMLYLASNTRPDISFSVHQCARFTHNTKVSHETSVKRIFRYLQGTKYNGLVFNPYKKKVVEFQPRAEDTWTLDSGLKVSAIYVFFPLMTVVPPLSPPPRDSPVRAPCLQPLCPSVHPSFSSSCLLSVHSD